MSVVPPPGSLTHGGDNREIHLSEPNEMPSMPSIPYIPHHYGEDRLLLLVRDPTTLFAAWEIRSETIDEVRTHSGLPLSAGLTLRLLQLGRGICSETVQEIDVAGSDTWYIRHHRPGALFLAQLGLGAGSDFVPILQSLPVRAPSGAESPLIDAEWTTIEAILERSRAGRYLASSPQSRP